MKKDKMNKAEQVQNESSPIKRKKKRKKAPIVIAVIVVLVVVWRLVACSMTGPAASVVMTTSPVLGELQESISTSGTVSSEEQKVYFAPVNGVLGKVNVAPGDVVKKGTLLISYDDKEAERAFKEAALQLTSSDSTYKGAISDSSEKQAKLNEANTNLNVLKQQIADNEAYLKSLQEKLSQNQRDTSNGLSEEGYQLSMKATQIQKEMAALSPDSPEYAQKAAQLQEVNTAQSRNSYLSQIASSSSSEYAVKMQKEIDEVTQRLADYKEYKAEMESQKSASEAGVLDTYQKQKYEADNEMSQLSFQKAQENYYTARQGITADFDGIVMDCTAVEGATVTGGLQLITLANSNEVKVSFSASKYDLAKLEKGQKASITISGNTYEGEISKINRMATAGSSGTPMVGVEIHITNPDDGIILGLDAKIVIYTHKVENALLVPVEAINADKDGDFLFVAENGVVVRKPVVCGISSENFAEIKEGITENDQVIVSSVATLTEGMAVVAVPGAGGAVGGGASSMGISGVSSAVTVTE